MDQEKITLSHSKQVDEYFFRQKLIMIFIASFVLAIFISSFVFISPLVSVFVVFIAAAVLVAERVWHKKVSAEIILITLALVSFSLGALRYSVKDFHLPSVQLESQVGETVELRGIVVGEPEAKDASTRLIVEIGSDPTSSRLRGAKEKILVTADLYTSAVYGDEVRVEGKFAKPGVIDDGVGRAFDYAAYLAKDDIYYTLSFSKVEVLSNGHGNTLKHALYKIKRAFVERARAIFSEPHASLLAGLIVAGKDAMPKDILEEFRRAGVVHIVVLSGYNITIIAEFLRRMFESILLATRFGGRPALAAGVSILGIIFFVLMTGAEATVVRASIMVLVVIAAKLFGRAYSAPRALVGAAFVMLLENPKILVFDPSFQLSFLATAALIYAVPVVEKYLSKLPSKWSLRGVVSTTLGTQLVVLPLLIYSMGDVSLVSLPANILILLLIPATMLAGFVATTVSYVSTLAALPLAYVAHLLLSWILSVSHFFGNLSFASINVSFFPLWLLVFCYGVIVAVVVRNERNKEKARPLQL